MRHDFGQAVVVIAFDPHHFDFALWIGKLANEAEKFPVLFFQASEIEVGKNIAQQNEAAILIFLQDAQSLARAAHVRAEVQIRKDQRVVNSDSGLPRFCILAKLVLRGDELAISREPEVTGK